MSYPTNFEEYKECIRLLIDCHIETIPAEIIHSYHPVYGKSPKFKCRKGWFQGILTIAVIGETHGFLSKESEAYKIFTDFCRYLDDSGLRKRLTNKEDIRQGNKVLTALLNLPKK
jgi:hypothetical protein